MFRSDRLDELIKRSPDAQARLGFDAEFVTVAHGARITPGPLALGPLGALRYEGLPRPLRTRRRNEPASTRSAAFNEPAELI
jgi:hypothetical protein